MDIWEQLIDVRFLNISLRPGTDTELCTLQSVFISTVLDRVLLSPYGLQLVWKYKEHLRNLWEEHKIHQTSSGSSQRIAIILSEKLSNIKISDPKSRTLFLEEFDTILEKF